MKLVSVWLNRLLRELLPVVDKLFVECAESLRDTAALGAALMDLEQLSRHGSSDSSVNAQYADKVPQQPCLKAYDFDKLYTKIPLHDTYTSVMQFMTQVFEAAATQDSVALKFMPRGMLFG